MEITKEKRVNPNKLPFLQAQVLVKIYSDIKDRKATRLEELSEITGYPQKSRILDGAIRALAQKGFLDGDFNYGFSVPDRSFVPEDFMKIIIRF